jgi:type II secretory pathway component GspD/PulD (secretin)
MLCQTEKTKYTKRVLAGAAVWLSVLVVSAALVFAQDPAAAPSESTVAAPAVEPAQAVQAAAPATPTETAAAEEEVIQPVLSGQSIQTISFKKDMPIKDALRMLAQMYQKNIVPSAKVDGIVTVSYLYDVTFEEALQAILGTHKYEAKGNFIKVYTNEEFMQDKSRFEFKTIPLYYINAEEAKKLATPLLSEFGQLGVTSPAKMDTQPGTGGDSLAIHDRLVVSDYPENVEKIRTMLAEVDSKPSQVLIEVTVMKATLTEDLDYGIDWNSVEGVQVDKTNQLSGLMQDGFAGAVNSGGVTGLTVGITIDNLVAHIRALEGVTDVAIMANPKILALNKQAGKLIIGKQEGYRSLTNLSDGGNQTQQVEFLESGTVLEFRPFIGRDGLIRMEIRPEQSTGEIVNQLPNKTTTEVITNVMVKDGQTIVLGGLFQEETNLTRNQTPLLGEIPIIGELFKQVTDHSQRTELVVLITPHIINDPEDANGAERLEDVYRLAYNARKDIHWMSRARYADERYNRAVKEYTAGNYDAALAELNGPYAITPRNHLDAIRLRERILRETQPDQAASLERVMMKKIEKEESGKWLRR